MTLRDWISLFVLLVPSSLLALASLSLVILGYLSGNMGFTANGMLVGFCCFPVFWACAEVADLI